MVLSLQRLTNGSRPATARRRLDEHSEDAGGSEPGKAGNDQPPK
jgi:hypothetical protein